MSGDKYTYLRINSLEMPFKKDDNSYTFKTASPSTQIDVYSVAEELSAAQPIAFVEAGEGEDYFAYFMVYRTLATKDAAIFFSNYRYGEYLADGTLVIKCKAKQTLTQWLRRFKKVKKASWGKELNRVYEGAVSFPSL